MTSESVAKFRRGRVRREVIFKPKEAKLVDRAAREAGVPAATYSKRAVIDRAKQDLASKGAEKLLACAVSN